MTDKGPKAAKELIDRAPKPIKEGASNDEVASFKNKLEAMAVVELK